jgi:hypothetical protein
MARLTVCAGCGLTPWHQLPEKGTSPQLHNSAARHRHREFGRKRINGWLFGYAITVAKRRWAAAETVNA